MYPLNTYMNKYKATHTMDYLYFGRIEVKYKNALQNKTTYCLQYTVLELVLFFKKKSEFQKEFPSATF